MKVRRSIMAALPGAVACAAALASTSCAGAAGSSRVEDKARRDVPIAVCRKALTTNDTTEGGAPRVDAYWSVLFPTFRGFAFPFDSTSRDCVGDSILLSDKPAPPATLTVAPGDWTSAAGEEGLEAVWLRASPPGDRASGTLALMRARPSELDVYSIGLYQGSAKHSRFEFAKMGTQALLLAHDESCADTAAGSECESTLLVYIIAGGQLKLAAKSSTEHVQNGSMKDLGRVQWRLTTEPPVFDAQSMRIKEKLAVHDAREDEVRKSEGERVFTLKGEELTPAADSIWAQVR